MRTKIVIDENLITAAHRATGIQTKRAVVEEGLRVLVRLHRQSAAKAWRGKLGWEGDLDAMRSDGSTPIATLTRWSTIWA